MNDTTEDRNSTPTKPDDTVLAAIVLVVGLAIVLGVGYYLWKKKLIFASSDNR